MTRHRYRHRGRRDDRRQPSNIRLGLRPVPGVVGDLDGRRVADARTQRLNSPVSDQFTGGGDNEK
jgi:hypothetical protein